MNARKVLESDEEDTKVCSVCGNKFKPEYGEHSRCKGCLSDQHAAAEKDNAREEALISSRRILQSLTEGPLEVPGRRNRYNHPDFVAADLESRCTMAFEDNLDGVEREYVEDVVDEMMKQGLTTGDDDKDNDMFFDIARTVRVKAIVDRNALNKVLKKYGLAGGASGPGTKVREPINDPRFGPH